MMLSFFRSSLARSERCCGVGQERFDLNDVKGLEKEIGNLELINYRNRYCLLLKSICHMNFSGATEQIPVLILKS